MALSVAACDGQESKPAESGEAGGASGGDSITIWAWDESFNIKAANVAKEMYAEVNPDVEVNIVTMAQDDIVAKLNTNHGYFCRVFKKMTGKTPSQYRRSMKEWKV